MATEESHVRTYLQVQLILAAVPCDAIVSSTRLPRHPVLGYTFVTYLPLPHRTTTNLYRVHVGINVN